MDKMNEKNILFVCTGNTCRSPMAEALARHIFTQAGIEATYSSAGVSAYGKQPASLYALQVMEAEGLDITGHTSRMITKTLMTQASLVFTMTSFHKLKLEMMYPEAIEKIYTLAEYAGKSGEVSDPFGMGFNEYAACARQIREWLGACVISLCNKQ